MRMNLARLSEAGYLRPHSTSKSEFGQISEAEAAELLAEADMFKSQLETWLRDNFPAL